MMFSVSYIAIVASYVASKAAAACIYACTNSKARDMIIRLRIYSYLYISI